MARRWVANLDIYRKVPGDLVEGTREGRLLSWAAVLLILTLFLQETRQFWRSEVKTDLTLDTDDSKYVRVNFNITMLDLKCDYATIDVVSVLGTEQNVSKNVRKWTVDGEGVAQRLVNTRAQLQADIQMHDSKVTETLEDLHQDGEDAVSLDATTFEFAKTEYEYLFVDFYASWCSHCRDLAPTWETLAEVMVDVGDKLVKEDADSADYSKEEYEEAVKLEMPVVIAKIDCVDHRDLCRSEGIRGYPTLRLFIDGEPYSGGDYYGHRTVLGMTQFLENAEDHHRSEIEDDERYLKAAQDAVKKRLNVSEEEKQWAEGVERSRHQFQTKWNPDDHPGCQLSGHLMLNRVPGNFYIQARSKTHDLAPHMTNVSHQVHHLSFGDDYLIDHLKQNQRSLNFPGNIVESTTPMENQVYVTHNLHEAYHHYLKLVSTNFDNQIRKTWQKGRSAVRSTVAYQVLQSTELAFYRQDIVPEAKFIIDLSPIAVSYRMKERKWYEYLTSLMAIIGGTFTVLGFLEAGVRTVTHRKPGTPMKKRRGY